MTIFLTIFRNETQHNNAISLLFHTHILVWSFLASSHSSLGSFPPLESNSSLHNGVRGDSYNSAWVEVEIMDSWRFKLRLGSWNVTVDWIFPFGFTHSCCDELGVHPFHLISLLVSGALQNVVDPTKQWQQRLQHQQIRCICSIFWFLLVYNWFIKWFHSL